MPGHQHGLLDVILHARGSDRYILRDAAVSAERDPEQTC